MRKAQEEHSTTPVALMEETLDITVDEDLERSVLRSSLERLDEEISERADGIAAELMSSENLGGYWSRGFPPSNNRGTGE